MPAHRRALVLLALGAALASGPHQPTRAAADGIPDLPRLMVWAWERPEDLRGLPDGAGVAFLAATYQLGGASFDRALRHQPLRVDAGTPLVAVVRIETDAAQPLTFDVKNIRTLAADIAARQHQPGVRTLQIDFDATLSERPFYRELLGVVRAELGDTPLSMTALASWCMDDNWIADLPVDEIVPMLFRLGPVNVPFAEAGARNRFRGAGCAAAVGVSTDEPTPPLAGRRRVYVFHPRSWTSDALAHAAVEAAR